MKKQKQTNLSILDVLFRLGHTSEIHFKNTEKQKFLGVMSDCELLKLKSVVSQKSKYLSVYPLFTFICDTS